MSFPIAFLLSLSIFSHLPYAQIVSDSWILFPSVSISHPPSPLDFDNSSRLYSLPRDEWTHTLHSQTLQLPILTAPILNLLSEAHIEMFELVADIASTTNDAEADISIAYSRCSLNESWHHSSFLDRICSLLEDHHLAHKGSSIWDQCLTRVKNPRSAMLPCERLREFTRHRSGLVVDAEIGQFRSDCSCYILRLSMPSFDPARFFNLATSLRFNDVSSPLAYISVSSESTVSFTFSAYVSSLTDPTRVSKLHWSTLYRTVDPSFVLPERVDHSVWRQSAEKLAASLQISKLESVVAFSSVAINDLMQLAVSRVAPGDIIVDYPDAAPSLCNQIPRSLSREFYGVYMLFRYGHDRNAALSLEAVCAARTRFQHSSRAKVEFTLSSSLEKTGFHREILTNISINVLTPALLTDGSNQLNATLSLMDIIPSHSFVDINELNELARLSLPKGSSYLTYQAIDLEKPVSDGAQHVVVTQRELVLHFPMIAESQYVFRLQFRLPLHFRYQLSQNDQSHVTLSLWHPLVMLRLGNMTFFGSSVSSFVNQAPLAISIPAGQVQDRALVYVSTWAVILFGLSWLLVEMQYSRYISLVQVHSFLYR